MDIRSKLFQLCISAAHKSMRLGKFFPPPKIRCYKARFYDHEIVKESSAEHVVLDRGHLVYVHDVGEKWRSWERQKFNNIDDFIRYYYKGRLHGEFATYPIFFSGDYYSAAIEGKQAQWVANREKIRTLLIDRLENHLSGYWHLLLKFGLGL